MNIFHTSYFLFCFGILACGDDPILEQAKNLETKQDKQETNKEKKEQLPEIAPPKEAKKEPSAKLPIVQPPKVAPPKEEPKEGVAPPPPNPKDGDFITVSGVISVNNWSGKPIRIDVFDGDQRNIGGNRPSVIISTTLDTIGEYTIHLPEKEQNVWIGAYIDEDLDGRPGPEDPSGWYEGNPISSHKKQVGIDFSLGLPDGPKQ